MDTRIVIAIAVVVMVLVILAGWAYSSNRRRLQLRESFGPEHERTVRQQGDARRAEDVLEDRQRRVAGMEIRRLPEPAIQRYSQHWWEVQKHFVDEPDASLQEADELVSDVMSARGYPIADFEQRAADISVDHPHIVENYRIAHNIALRHQRGEADTEDLRRALVHYRLLFQELLDRRSTDRREAA
jgi:hypothetical protein